MDSRKPAYFGSVRFFKNIILLAVVLAIGISAAFALHYKQQYKTLLQAVGAAESGGSIVIDGEGPSYQKLYPDFRAPAEYAATVRESRKAYITIDLVSYVGAGDILDQLDELGVRATFFAAAPHSDSDGEILRRIVDSGHTLGMLSWSKDCAVMYASVENYLNDMQQIFTYIQETTGVTPTLFRVYGGSINSYNSGIYQPMLAEMIRRGFVPFDWNISSQVGQSTPTAEAQVKNISEALGRVDRAVIQFQDTQDLEETRKAMPLLVEAIQQAGFSIEPLTAVTKPVLFAGGTS